MDRKCGKYVVMEQSGKQPMSIGGTTVPFPNLGNDEAQSSACKFATSIDVTGDAGPNLNDICINRGTLGLPNFPNRESQHFQVTRSLFSGWSLWKIFLACLLASVITVAIGVLIVSLVYNGKNNNAPIFIQLTQNQGTISLTETSSSDSSKTTVATSTTDSTTTSSTMTTITEHTSTELTSIPTTDSTETTIATDATSTEKTITDITEGTTKTATTASTTSTETMTTTVATTTPHPTTTTVAGTTTEGTTTTDTTASSTST
ncbi:dynactin-associated protein [Monodon monoceros]|uniref:Dynactin-associated protein n=1 Tax=Delphinapterus leucas TaxID=9749 RepID=A0A2Y9NZ65_DELLE|nr:dynactin-associated protein [Delphinapterus leucas]XP_022440164.1 dynactin-associated protein [Delphinapterus leucas]XP_022440165.1 dynactin-associated protein [Delphinapterus leucas]XP_029078663.1 dynactin-associated protein [Monodon monoceros]